MKQVVSLEGVHFGYSSSTDIEIENLSVKTGEVIGILGRSGVGKTTLLRLCAGHVTPQRGRVRWYSNTAPTFSSQADTVFEWRTVKKNISFSLEMNGYEPDIIQKRVKALLKLTGLESRSQDYPSSLSGGMRQRVAFARAIASKPPLVLLDEPFGALDILTRRRLEVDYKSLLEHESETSVMLVTHDIENAIRLANRIIILDRKPARIVYDNQNELSEVSEIPLAQLHSKIEELRAFLGG